MDIEKEIDRAMEIVQKMKEAQSKKVEPMKASLEYIYHFTCESCSLWWSIAFQTPLKKRIWYCPWCGHKHAEGGDVFLTSDEDILNWRDR